MKTFSPHSNNHHTVHKYSTTKSLCLLLSISTCKQVTFTNLCWPVSITLACHNSSSMKSFRYCSPTGNSLNVCWISLPGAVWLNEPFSVQMGTKLSTFTTCLLIWPRQKKCQQKACSIDMEGPCIITRLRAHSQGSKQRDLWEVECINNDNRDFVEHDLIGWFKAHSVSDA